MKNLCSGKQGYFSWDIRDSIPEWSKSVIYENLGEKNSFPGKMKNSKILGVAFGKNKSGRPAREQSSREREFREWGV